MRSVARAILVRLLAIGPSDPEWPGSDWAAEFVEGLEERHGRVRVRHVLSPGTLRFVWLVRRRRAATRAATAWGRGGRMGRLGAGYWEGLVTDARQAARGIGRDARLAAFVVATLALGIGANAALFGVADRLFLGGPAQVRDPGTLVRAFLEFDEEGGVPARVSPWIPHATAEAIARGATRMSSTGVYRTAEGLARVQGEVRTLRAATVGGDFFQTLGTVPSQGRLLRPGEDDPGSAVISHDLWTRSFRSDPSPIGSTFLFAGATRTVVGVAPPGFSGVGLGRVDVWLPLDPAEAGGWNWHLVGRVAGGDATGAAAGLAGDEADAIHRRTDPGRFFQWALGGRVVMRPVGADEEGEEPAEVAVSRFLLAVSGLALLIGIANVANLLMARLTRREREVAVRLALGVGRWRLTRLLVLEGLSLAALGGLASLPVAWLGGALLRRLLLPDVAWTGSPLDTRVLAVGGALTVATGLLVAILPSLRAGRADVSGGLRTSGGRAGGRRGRSGLVLAGAQVTLSAALLVTAGLFFKSFWALRVTDLGIDADRMVAITLQSLDPDGIPSPSEEEHAVYREALRVAREDRDVDAAALTLGLPFVYTFGLSIELPGRDSVPALPGGGPYFSAVTSDYFEVAGTPILRGRGFTEAEVAGAEAVVVVGATTAEALWGGDALGACLHVGSAESSPCRRVVGVAQDVHRRGYREPASLQFYVPLEPGGGFGGLALLVRTRAGASGVLDRLGEALVRSTPLVDHAEVLSLRAVLEPQLRPWRLGSWVLALASLLALAISMTGVYGVLAYLVERRRREIGVRIALGASGRQVRALVLRTGMGATSVGLGLGLAMVLGGRGWIEPLLFETSASDPTVLAGAVATLVVVAALACLLPAHRASKVEPATCLDSE